MGAHFRWGAFGSSAFLLCAPGVWAQETSFYYDAIENGRLVGGQITVDLSDPDQRREFGADLPAGFRVAAWPVTTIRDNGPSSNRIDLVFVGDGYTMANLAQYAVHVDAIAAPFFVEEPLGAYSSYFNVHRVDVISNQSGVDELDLGIYKDTALDMAFGCFGVTRALCIDTSKALAAASSAPQADQILALANSSRYGGTGSSTYNLATLSGDNDSSIEIALHEFGHSLAALADEYDYGGTPLFTGSEPRQANVSTYPAGEMLTLQTKWFRWLDILHVGTFEGASTHTLGLYRPTYNSKMRTLDRPFEEVNVEQLVKSMYDIVSPVDDATPASVEPLLGCQTLFVQPLRPTGHDLTVQWFVDGIVVPKVSGPTFRPAEHLLAPGVYAVSVTVADETPRVRDEGFRNERMRFTRSWTIESRVPAAECECRSACGDLERDRSIDLRDFAEFAVCFGEQALSRRGCVCADLNGDGGIDLADYVGMAELFGEPPVFEYPMCAPP